MKVLVVEDNSVTADMLRLALSERSIELDHVTTGAEVLTVMPSGGYDAVLLDLRMPGMDGMDVLKALSRHSTSVVLFTAASDEEVAQVVAAFPGLEVVRKPADVPEILEALKRARGGV